MYCRPLSIAICYLATAQASWHAPTTFFRSGQSACPEIVTFGDYKQSAVEEYAWTKYISIKALEEKLTRFMTPKDSSNMSFTKQAFRDAVIKTAFYVDSVSPHTMNQNRELGLFLDTVYDEFAAQRGGFASMIVFVSVCLHNTPCLGSFDKPDRTNTRFNVCRSVLQLYSQEYYEVASSGGHYNYVDQPWRIADIEKGVIQDLIRVYKTCFYYPENKHAMMRVVYEMKSNEHMLINSNDNYRSFNNYLDFPNYHDLVDKMRRRILINNYLMLFLKVDVD